MSLDQITIRPAEPRDAAAIASVHDAAWRGAYRGIIPGVALERMIERRGPAWWRRLIDQQRGVLVLMVGRKLVGYATHGPNRSQTLRVRGEIYELYIHPTYQGLGFGTRLFAATRMRLEAARLVPFVVWALEDNEMATCFYCALGGEAVAHGTEYFGVPGQAPREQSDAQLVDVAATRGERCRKLAFVWGSGD